MHVSYTSTELLLQTQTGGKDGQQPFPKGPPVLQAGFPWKPTLSGNTMGKILRHISRSDPVGERWNKGLGQGKSWAAVWFQPSTHALPRSSGLILPLRVAVSCDQGARPLCLILEAAAEGDSPSEWAAEGCVLGALAHLGPSVLHRSAHPIVWGF